MGSRNRYRQRNKENLSVILSNFVLVITILGIGGMMYVHTDHKIDEMKNEMKDFHGRLISIEERTKTIDIK